MRLIDADELKQNKVYSEERHEYIVPVAYIDWAKTVDPTDIGFVEADKVRETIYEKQRALCPTGMCGRRYVYGDKELDEFDMWQEILDKINAIR